MMASLYSSSNASEPHDYVTYGLTCNNYKKNRKGALGG